MESQPRGFISRLFGSRRREPAHTPHAVCGCWRVASVSTPQKPHRGCPGPSLLGTGETPDLNWQEEAHGLAGSVLENAVASDDPFAAFPFPVPCFRN